MACLEFYRMVGVSSSPALTWFGVIWTVLLILQPHFPYEYLVPLLLVSGVVLSLIITLLGSRHEGAFIRWVWVISGILYLGWLLSYLVALRVEAALGWTFLVVAAVFASDTMAFFIGKAFGRHHLAPRISPSKTWEGAVAGVFGAVAASVIVTVIFDLHMGYLASSVLGILVSIFGQLGDLVESMIKRSAGVKDSGNLLPGHGGLLDRMDSLIFAGVVVYSFYIFTVLKVFS